MHFAGLGVRAYRQQLTSPIVQIAEIHLTHQMAGILGYLPKFGDQPLSARLCRGQQ